MKLHSAKDTVHALGSNSNMIKLHVHFKYKR